MSEMIAVWGSPGSGKTTFATKLALALYEKFNVKIIVIYADIETPTLQLVTPSNSGQRSIGELLAKPRIETDDVISNMVTLKRKDNLGFMGYVSRDNKNKYPEYNANKVKELFDACMYESERDKANNIQTIVIVDCSSNLNDLLSDIALREADKVYRLLSPTAKSMSFMSSKLPMLTDPQYRLEQHKVVLNNNHDANGPVEELKAQLGGVDLMIPYSKKLRDAFENGGIITRINERMVNKSFNLAVSGLV